MFTLVIYVIFFCEGIPLLGPLKKVLNVSICLIKLLLFKKIAWDFSVVMPKYRCKYLCKKLKIFLNGETLCNIIEEQH